MNKKNKVKVIVLFFDFFLILDLNCKQKNIIFSKKLVSEKNKIKTKEAEKQKK